MGGGKSDKESSTTPRAASPVVTDVADEEKDKNANGPAETVVLTKAVEAAAAAVEAVSTAQEKAQGLKEETPLDLSKKKEKEKMDELEIPSSQGKFIAFFEFFIVVIQIFYFQQFRIASTTRFVKAEWNTLIGPRSCLTFRIGRTTTRLCTFCRHCTERQRYTIRRINDLVTIQSIFESMN